MPTLPSEIILIVSASNGTAVLVVPQQVSQSIIVQPPAVQGLTVTPPATPVVSAVLVTSSVAPAVVINQQTVSQSIAITPPGQALTILVNANPPSGVSVSSISSSHALFADSALSASYANSVKFSNILNLPTLLSGSGQVDFSALTNRPHDIFLTGSNSTTDITEGAKLFYTDVRVASKINALGLFSSSQQVTYAQISSIPNDIFRTTINSTTEITEGAKLFYTDARVVTKINALGVLSSSGQVAYAGISGVPNDIFRTGSHTTNDIVEGSKLFFTDIRVKSKLNVEGVYSSSAQVNYPQISAIPADIFKTGSHTTTDITEGAKLFYTAGRVKSDLNANNVVSSSAQIAYSGLSGVPGDIFRTGSHSTTNITEGSNLFYTDVRVKTKLSADGVISSSAQVNYGQLVGIPADIFKTGSHSTSDITEGGKLFFTSGRVKTELNNNAVVSSSAQINTSTVVEGTQLFYTDARVLTKINATGLFSSSGQVSYAGLSGIPGDLFKTGSHTTTDITEGAKLFYTSGRVKTDLNTNGVISSSAQVTIPASQVTAGNFGVGAYRFPSSSVGINTAGPAANLHVSGNQLIENGTGSLVGLVVRNAKNQAANLQEWQSSGSAVMSYVSASGEVVTPSVIEGGIALVNKYLSVNGGTVGGDLTVTGTLTATEFKSTLVSSSIVYQSGSTKFGDTLDDVMSVTGSLQVSGSLVLVGGLTGSVFGVATSAVSSSYALSSSYAVSSSYSVSSSYAVTSSYAVSASSVNFANIAAKPTLVSASAQITYSGISAIPADIFKTGSHSTTDITEGTKLFYTDTRVQSKIDAVGVFSSSAQVNTSTVVEGSKLFYTDARVLTKINAVGLFSASAQVVYSGLSGIPADIFKTGSHSTTDITEGANLFFTNARVKAKNDADGVVSSSAQISYSGLSGIPADVFRYNTNTTDNVLEGSSNLFFTNARVKTKLNADGVVSSSQQIIYGNISSIPSDIFRTTINTSDVITEGSTKLFFTSARVKTELNTNAVVSSSAQITYSGISGIPGEIFRTGSHTTTDITEGTKLFFTSARVKTELNSNTVISSSAQVRNQITGSGIISYDPVTGIVSASGGGTVTSIGLIGGSGITITGGPILNSGSITVVNAGAVSVAGRTGAILLTAADVAPGVFPNGNYTINGTLNATSIVETSTLRRKHCIVTQDSQLNSILRLRPVEFTWKDTHKRDKGLIAEEVAMVYPEFVAFEEINGQMLPAAVNYSKMVSVLVQALQEMNARVVELEKKQSLWTRIKLYWRSKWRS
jgi:predicted RecA/RadA family phage recombinase